MVAVYKAGAAGSPARRARGPLRACNVMSHLLVTSAFYAPKTASCGKPGVTSRAAAWRLAPYSAEVQRPAHIRAYLG